MIQENRKYNSEEFFELVKDSEERFELIDGDISDMSAPSELHQDIVLALGAELKNYIRSSGGKCKTIIAPFDVVLNDRNIVQPDVMVVCDSSKLDGKRCNGAPDFVIEITSANYSRDYSKIMLYKESGVREYWIVDTQKKKVVVLFLGKNPNTFTLYDFNQDIPVNICDGKLAINIAQLLSY